MDLSLIAGPCAAENEHQVISTARELKERGIHSFRACLWKPRTSPGFEGVGERGFPWLAEVSKLGMTVGTEVLLPEHVTALTNYIHRSNADAQVLVWLGARNQNHLIQREIAARMKDTAPTTKLMIKNQPWKDESHWLGIVEHVRSIGVPDHQIVLCHRGFNPNGHPNPRGLRNLPDIELMKRVKQNTGLPMIYDLSHIAGSRRNVPLVLAELIHQGEPCDGIMVEVHPTPETALTDSQQQITVQELEQLLNMLDSTSAVNERILNV